MFDIVGSVEVLVGSIEQEYEPLREQVREMLATPGTDRDDDSTFQMELRRLQLTTDKLGKDLKQVRGALDAIKKGKHGTSIGIGSFVLLKDDQGFVVCGILLLNGPRTDDSSDTPAVILTPNAPKARELMSCNVGDDFLLPFHGTWRKMQVAEIH